MPILQKQILSAFTLVVAASAAAQSPKPAITGFVVDAQTKQPLVGAVVRVSGASVSPTAVTDAQGRFAARAAAGVEADISYIPEFGISDSRFSCYARFPIGAYYICPPNNMDGKMQNCKV